MAELVLFLCLMLLFQVDVIRKAAYGFLAFLAGSLFLVMIFLFLLVVW